MLKTAILLRSRGLSNAMEMTPGQALFAALTLAEDDRERHVTDLDATAVATRWGFNSKPDEFEQFRKNLRR